MKIVLATNNAGKLRELRELLAPRACVVLPKSQFTAEEVAETGTNFIENALIKARHAARAAKLPAIADDSGIEVDALQGAPGIYSARYAGAQASDSDNVRKLLVELVDVSQEQRSARYRCALAYVRDAHDPAPLVCEATWEGQIATAPRGAGGFGYDPVFWLPERQLTAAELSVEEKNRISHRAQALRQLLVLMDTLCATD